MLVLIVDARAGLMPLDEELARLLRRTGKPVIVAANKVDSQQQESLTGPLHSLGLPVFPVSAEHGYGLDGLLEYISEKASVPDAVEGVETENTDEGNEARRAIEANRPPQVAIIGRPNVGKSALLNQLAGEQRSIVSPVAGTTRDSVDSLVEHDGKLYKFVDTAGIRRKGKDERAFGKIERRDGAKKFGAHRRCAVDCGCIAGSCVRRCDDRGLCGAVGMFCNYCDEQI